MTPASGVYFVRVTYESGEAVKTLVKRWKCRNGLPIMKNKQKRQQLNNIDNVY